MVVVVLVVRSKPLLHLKDDSSSSSSSSSSFSKAKGSKKESKKKSRKESKKEEKKISSKSKGKGRGKEEEKGGRKRKASGVTSEPLAKRARKETSHVVLRPFVPPSDEVLSAEMQLDKDVQGRQLTEVQWYKYLLENKAKFANTGASHIGQVLRQTERQHEYTKETAMTFRDFTSLLLSMPEMWKNMRLAADVAGL